MSKAEEIFEKRLFGTDSSPLKQKEGEEEKSEMKDYYFTFGQGHTNNEGLILRNYWVRVKADSYDKAREIFINEFSSKQLPRPMQWGFQYEGLDYFKPEYFPGGEYAYFKQEQP